MPVAGGSAARARRVRNGISGPAGLTARRRRGRATWRLRRFATLRSTTCAATRFPSALALAMPAAFVIRRAFVMGNLLRHYRAVATLRWSQPQLIADME